MSNTGKELLLPQRFDFMAKLLYLYCYDNKLETDFFKDLYENHMLTFNGCRELPDSTIDGCGITKNNINDFFNEYHSLIENMKHNGFDPSRAIPVGTDGLLENGTHRMITSYYYSIPPVIKKVDTPGQRYNYNFFLGRTGFPPLDRKYADAMALEYVNHNSNIRCMVLYPCAYNEQAISGVFNIIQKYGVIYYHKEVKLSHTGLNNVIKEMYRGEDWIGGNFPTTGPYGKYKYACFPHNPIIYISIVMNDVSKCIEMKQECRAIYNMGKHSLHVSDFIEDTWRISSCLLNENSIHFLNKCRTNLIDNHPNNMTTNTKNTLITFFESVRNNRKDYCITSSVILEMYGLRHAKDVDYLHKNNFDIKEQNIGVHEGIWLSYYANTKDDIIYNPENHFYFNGFKFAAPHVIMKMKKNRNETKDQKDIELLTRIL